MYKVESVSKEGWIFVSGDNSFYEPDSFIALLKEYQNDIGGKIIVNFNDDQYTITKDPLNLIFQWDSLFGTTVIVPLKTDMLKAKNKITILCDRLNELHK